MYLYVLIKYDALVSDFIDTKNAILNFLYNFF